jgi:phage tail-like protein
MSAPGADPLHTFRFELSFADDPLGSGGNSQGNGGQGQGGSGQGGSGQGGAQPSGAFAECTGLEATMEPKVIKSGGNNFGAFQRAGPVTFATVILKRGISRGGELFNWFRRVTSGEYGYRRTVYIALRAPSATAEGERGETAMTWRLESALPIKFKAADFNAKATEVGVEELHLAHEGLFLEAPEGGGAESA